jgi:hypothetical protein
MERGRPKLESGLPNPSLRTQTDSLGRVPAQFAGGLKPTNAPRLRSGGAIMIVQPGETSQSLLSLNVSLDIYPR